MDENGLREMGFLGRDLFFRMLGSWLCMPVTVFLIAFHRTARGGLQAGKVIAVLLSSIALWRRHATVVL